MTITAEQAAKLLEDGESWSDSNVEVITDLAAALIASEAARKLAEERLAVLIGHAYDAIIRDEKDAVVWAQLLAAMARSTMADAARGVWGGFWSAAAFTFRATSEGFKFLAGVCSAIAGKKEIDNG